jgi:uncharacterized protein YydD (DUF2326 family)
MRLIKLSANKSSFKTIVFNRTGLSIIAAEKQDIQEKGGNKTFNSVGKTLTLAIINFCLGSKMNKAFKEYLPDWEFTLDFEIKDIPKSVIRNTNNQNEVIFNDKKIKLKSFTDELGESIFSLNNEIPYLSFRSLISRFTRLSKSEYTGFDKFGESEQPYPKLLNNSYLMGLDTDLVVEKGRLKEQLDQTKRSKDAIEKDPIFQPLSKDKKIQLRIIELDDEIKRLSGKLKIFQIADDYDKIRKESDKLTYDIGALAYQSKIIIQTIENIKKSLDIQPDIKRNGVVKLYEEVRLNFAENIKKRLEDVELFHSKIVADRTRNLNTEKQKFEKELKRIEEEKSQLGKERDDLIVYLNQHGALEEYTAMHNRLSNLQIEAHKLKESQNMLESLAKRKSETLIELNEQNIKGQNYLHEHNFSESNFATSFREISKSFYQDKAAGSILVNNNENLNTIRYDITAHIDSDAGDGVGNVKIFCFDLSMMLAKNNHNIKFIFHDSKLLDGIDPRQKAILLKTAYAKSLDNDFQYIISANQNDLEDIKEEFDNSELYDTIITKNKVITLKDSSDEDKLLGIHVDMNYEK